MSETLEQAIRSATADHCSTCWRPQATDEHWATTLEEERSDLCWEPSPEACIWDFGIDPADLIADAVRAWLLSRERIDAICELRWPRYDEADGGTQAEMRRIVSEPLAAVLGVLTGTEAEVPG